MADETRQNMVTADEKQTFKGALAGGVTPEQFAAEEAYLSEVIDFIDERTGYLAGALDGIAEEMIDLKASAWEEHLELKSDSTNGQADSAFVQDELARGARTEQDYAEERRILTRMRKKPYFGHISFVFEGEKFPEEVYIGLKDIIDLEHFRQYVIDWRAPLAAVYYNVNEPGPASYKHKERLIKGDLKAKYQLEIEGGKLLRVINSTEQILDDILQIVLSGVASPVMKQIAQTLQREQNVIIRTELNRNLLIQGVAGSGKTSIALHRAAYMMYQDPSIKADNILLVTPSESFAAYVSQVLPSLDEEHVRSLTLEQILRYELADAEERYLDYGFAKASREKVQTLSGPDWVKRVEAFAELTERQVFAPEDIVTRYMTVPKKLLKRLFYENYRFLPPFKRHEAILNHLRDMSMSEADFRLVYDEIDQKMREMFILKDLRHAFMVFWRFAAEQEGVPKGLFREPFDTADMELLALLKVLLYGPAKNSWVRHLIVDEMQDLSFAAHETLRRAYPCPRTILGDINQAVRFKPGEAYLDGLAALYAKDQIKLERHELLTSYRSTKEITEYSREILKDQSIRPLERSGEPVKVRVFPRGEGQALLEDALEALLAWRRRGYRTAAVVFKTEKEAAVFRHFLKEANQRGTFEPLLFNQYLREEDAFAVTVTAVAQAKGVEFDAVLLADASEERYHEPIDRTLLYVAATRALHALKVSAEGTLSPFLPEA